MGEHFLTKAVHAGEARVRPDFGIVDSIQSSSAFTFANTAELMTLLNGETTRDEYSRYGNPNVRAVEQKLASLEGSEGAVLFSSGMAALSLLFLSILKPGDQLIFFDSCYHRTRQFCYEYLRGFGIRCTGIATNDFESLEAACDDRTRLIFAELPTNPHLTVIDLEQLASIAKSRGIATCVDSTLAGPINIRPIEFGIDFVAHSATKYLGGHNDLLAGVLCGRESALAPVRNLNGILGAVPAPYTAHMLGRGLKTLPLRLAQQNSSGLAIAQFLALHPRVQKVYYPGLETHPTYGLARKYLKGFGGLISFEIAGNSEETGRFIDALKIPRIGPSLGGVESLVEQPYLMSFFNTAPEVRKQLGIADSLVRLALGIEDTEDLIDDLKQAFERLERY